MKVFLSHSTSGADAKKIEEIAIKLRDKGHEVFFDGDTVDGGTGFDEKIEKGSFDDDSSTTYVTTFKRPNIK